MKALNLKGCGTALVTPFKNGEVDYDAYAALIRRQAASVDYLVALATTGETPTLSSEEKLKLLEITRANAGGKPIVVGCGANSVPATLSNIQLLDGDAVDAWLVVVPFYNKPTQEGMYLYFKEIASHTDKPVVLYNVPGRTGANMLPETCVRLAKDVPNIIGVKEASGKLEQAEAILKGTPKTFNVISGDDDLTFEMMKLGGAGVISVASNIAPDKVKAMTDAMLGGRQAEASELNTTLAELFKNCFVESNPIPAKAALSLMGLCTAEMRLPLTTASAKTVEIMKNTLKEL